MEVPVGLGHWSVPGGASKLRGLATDRQLQALDTAPIPNLGSGGNSYMMVFDKSSEISPLKVAFPPPHGNTTLRGRGTHSKASSAPAITIVEVP